MSGFWIILAAMVFAALALVVVPLWSQRRFSDTSRSRLNTELFREQVAELENDLREQRIGQAQYEQLRADLERALLGDIPEQDAGPVATGGGVSRFAVTLVTLVITGAAVTYYYFSAYQGDARDWIATKARFADAVSIAINDPDNLPEEAYEDLPNFTRVLQAQVLREGMRNADSLFLLGMSLLQLGLPEQASQFLSRAFHLRPERTDITTAYAQAIMMQNDNSLTPASGRLLHTVLQRDPGHQGALMLLGLGAFNNGDYEIAIRAWEPLLAALDPAGQGAALISQRLDEARNNLAQAGRTAASSSAGDQAIPAHPPGSVGEQAAKSSITVTVDLSSELRDRLQPEDMLFIFAKAASGPPMPLAAVRQAVVDFPVQVVLDDSKAMMPSMKLSDFDRVVVGARISKSGGAIARAGDFEGLSAPLDLNGDPLSVSLTVDRVVQ